jgi:hypothetical protein
VPRIGTVIVADKGFSGDGFEDCAVAALLRRANDGPDGLGKPGMSKRDRRVAARTRAASPPGGTQAQPESPGPAEPDTAAAQAEEDAPLAKVIPMPIFDPFAEADKRW